MHVITAELSPLIWYTQMSRKQIKACLNMVQQLMITLCNVIYIRFSVQMLEIHRTSTLKFGPG